MIAPMNTLSLTSVLPVPSMARIRDVVRSQFWFVPALCVVVSVVLGIALIELDKALPAAHGLILYPGPPTGAREFLSSIVQAMISFTGVVFSITIVVLQLTSGQFSPRVLRMFLRDGTIQLTLGVFMATFVYAMVVERTVGGGAGGDVFVPRIAVTVAFAFVLASVGLFIRYISHVANLIRVATIIAEIGHESREHFTHRYPADQPPSGPAPELPVLVSTPGSPEPGVLVAVNTAALTDLAADSGCVVVMVPRIGDFTPAGAPLFAIHADRLLPDVDLDDLGRRVGAEISLDNERTMEQDLAFGFRQLVDIANRALSPAVNDPTTACQVLDTLHDLLRRLATRHLPTGDHTASDGQLRVRIPQYQFADFLDLAVSEIWRYGSDAAQVPGRIAAMLTDLDRAALPEHRGDVRAWMHRLDVMLD